MYTVIAETINATPIETITCNINIKKYHNIFIDNPTPPNITNANIIIVDIKKFTPSLATNDIGKISLGKYTFFITLPLSIIIDDPLSTTAAKYCHGINPQHKYTV